MVNFITGINFIYGIFIILVVEFGSFTSEFLNIQYDSKNTNSIIKHSITLIISILLVNILLKLI